MLSMMQHNFNLIKHILYQEAHVLLKSIVLEWLALNNSLAVKDGLQCTRFTEGSRVIYNKTKIVEHLL